MSSTSSNLIQQKKPRIHSYSRWTKSIVTVINPKSIATVDGPNPTSILTCTLGMTGTMRLRFLVVVLLLGHALLVLENLPRRSRLWWVEWCSTTGGATIMSDAGGEAGTRGRPWRLLASTPVVESGV